MSAAMSDNHWRYAVPIRNQKTGEVRTVVVELSRDERLDALWMDALRPGWVGGPDGPVAHGYAAHRADALGSPDFVADGDIERVSALRLVN
jgi:hypothetical protein